MVMKIFVEGGGPTSATQGACRASFAKYVGKLVPRSTRRPRIIASGARRQAYDDFRRELVRPEPGGFPVLLVDSEDLVEPQHRANPWEHLAQREGDRWPPPAGVTPDQAQLMVVCVESWIAADPDTLEGYYGKDFRRSALPATNDLEAVAKADLYRALHQATRDTKKGAYGKNHAFDLVGLIEPSRVAERCAYFAPRFHRLIREHCG